MSWIHQQTQEPEPRNKAKLKTNTGDKIYQFEMYSWRYMYELCNSLPIAKNTMSLFFGNVLSEDPVLEVGGISENVKINKFMKNIFNEYYVPFLKEWWVAYHTTGIIFYKKKFLDEYNIYVPEKIDVTEGKAICKQNKKTGDREYIWVWNDDNQTQISDFTILYDVNVIGIELIPPSLVEDNLKEWSIFVSDILNNKKIRRKPNYLSIPYNTNLKSIVKKNFVLERMINASLTTEELKARMHVVWIEDIDYKDEPYHNLLETYGKKKDNYEKLLKSIEFHQVHNLPHKTLRDNNIVVSTEKDIENNEYVFGNPKQYNALNMGLAWGEEPYSKEEAMKSREEALKRSVGIDSNPIRNGDMESIFAGPVHKPSLLQKNNGKDLENEISQFRMDVADVFGVSISSISSGSGRVYATALKFAHETMKSRFTDLKHQMELVINKIYKNLLDFDLKFIRTLMKLMEMDVDYDLFEFKFHFIPTFNVDLKELSELYKMGLLDEEFTRQVVLRQLGFTNEYGTTVKRNNEQTETQIPNKGKRKAEDKKKKKKRKKIEDKKNDGVTLEIEQ